MKKQEVPIQPALFEMTSQGDMVLMDTTALDAISYVAVNRPVEIPPVEQQREEAAELADKLGWSVDSAMRKLGYLSDVKRYGRGSAIPVERAKKSRRGYHSKVPDNDSMYDPNWNISYEPLSAEQRKINAQGAEMARQIPSLMVSAEKTAEEARVQREIRERDARIAESWQRVECEATPEDPETLF